jgi:hypothetical protein
MADIAEVSSVAVASIAEVNGVAKASASKVCGVDVPSGGSYITATGGTITTDGDYKVHTFNSGGTHIYCYFWKWGC